MRLLICLYSRGMNVFILLLTLALLSQAHAFLSTSVMRSRGKSSSYSHCYHEVAIRYMKYLSDEGSEDNMDDGYDDGSSYRTESVKSGIISLLGGSIGSLPLAVAIGYFQQYSPQWELSHDALAISLFLFGVTYRYAVRLNEKNTMLQQGVVGAFAVVRALNMVDTSAGCSSLPLNCGPPFYYFDLPMITIGSVNFAESLLAFGFGALALESAFKKNFLTRCN